jgi:hypothetical protein
VFTALVEGSGFADVLDDAALDGYAVLEALPYEPGKVDSCVDADGCECRCGVYAWFEFGFVEYTKL